MGTTLDIRTHLYLTDLTLIPLMNKREALLEILLSVRERTQAKSGFLSCAVYSDCSAENRFKFWAQTLRTRLDEFHGKAEYYDDQKSQ